MSYLLMVSHGKGRRYIQGPEIERLTVADDVARSQAKHLNTRKSPRAPKVVVTILRKVKEHHYGN